MYCGRSIHEIIIRKPPGHEEHTEIADNQITAIIIRSNADPYAMKGEWAHGWTRHSDKCDAQMIRHLPKEVKESIKDEGQYRMNDGRILYSDGTERQA